MSLLHPRSFQVFSPQIRFVRRSLLAGFGLLALTGTSFLSTTASSADATAHTPRKQPFILGADISWVPQDEAAGATYFDKGVQKDVLEILGDHGINYIRLRIFVNPSAPGGYSRQGFCDLEHTKAMAKRIKEHHMGFLLDFHYGDTWTSPGHQAKPSAWVDLSFDDLTKAVHTWTRDVVTALKEQGTTPDMVQIGNEVSDGMLFPDGSRSNGANFAALVKAGCTAVREIDPKIQIMLHNHLGRDNAAVRKWVDNFLEHGVDFDVIGMSCYAEKQPGDWQRNFTDLAARYPKLKLVCAEYSPHKRELNDLMFAVPNERGLGTFLWEPIRYQEAFFDRGGQNAGGGAQRTNDQGNILGPAPRGKAPAASPAAGATPLVASATPAASASPTAPGATPPPNANGFGRRGNRNGGRYDTNSFMDLYDQMSKDYGNEALKKATGK